jgi:predicted ATPase
MPYMKLIEAYMEDFRSIEKLRVKIDEHLTVLVGPNAGGKSNIIDALSMLSLKNKMDFEDTRINSEKYFKRELPRLAFRLMLDESSKEALKDLIVNIDELDAIWVERLPDGFSVVPKGLKFAEVMESRREKIMLPKADGSKETFTGGKKALGLSYDVEKIKKFFAGDDKISFLEGEEREKYVCEEAAKVIEGMLPEVIVWDYHYAPEIHGSVDLKELAENPEKYPQTVKLLRYGGVLNIKEDLLKADFTRVDNLLHNASEKISALLQQHWSQSQNVRVHIAKTESRLEIRIGEKNCRVEPERRSQGMKYFLNFLIAFIELIEGKEKGKLVLLDDPGLMLHPKGQRDLLKLIKRMAAHNQVVYCTPSPYMLEEELLPNIRYVHRVQGEPTQVINELDPRNLPDDELLAFKKSGKKRGLFGL